MIYARGAPFTSSFSTIRRQSHPGRGENLGGLPPRRTPAGTRKGWTPAKERASSRTLFSGLEGLAGMGSVWTVVRSSSKTLADTHRDDRRHSAGLRVLGPSRRLDAVLHRLPHIHQNQIGRPLLKHPHGLHAIARLTHDESRKLQHPRQKRPIVRHIVHDENSPRNDAPDVAPPGHVGRVPDFKTGLINSRFSRCAPCSPGWRRMIRAKPSMAFNGVRSSGENAGDQTNCPLVRLEAIAIHVQRIEAETERTQHSDYGVRWKPKPKASAPGSRFKRNVIGST